MNNLVSSSNNQLKINDTHPEISTELIFHSPCPVPPVLSIIIPTYKRALSLDETLKSILTNSDIPYEIIIIDNNPERNDDTEKLLLKNYQTAGITYYKNQENIGMYGNTNRGFHLCTTKWVLILHDDDLLFPFSIKKIASFIHNHPDTDILISNAFNPKNQSDYQNFSTREPRESFVQSSLIKFLFSYHRIPCSGSLYNLDTFTETGCFSENYYPVSDLEFLIRLLILKKKIFIYKPPLMYYKMFDNTSQQQDTMLGILKKESEVFHKQILPLFTNKFIKKIIYTNFYSRIYYNYLYCQKFNQFSYSWNQIQKELSLKDPSFFTRCMISPLFILRKIILIVFFNNMSGNFYEIKNIFKQIIAFLPHSAK